MGSLLKMSPKTAESMMVDGMDGALGGGCGLVPALQHVRLGDQVRFRTEISHGTATANAFGQQVQQYHRLFLLPATGHCGGGTGPNAIGGGMPEPPAAYRHADHHVVSAVIKWVEQGIAPEKIIATKFDAAGNVTRSRPVCAYPAEAVYNGSGDMNDAANFSCWTPNLPERTVTDSDLVNIRNALTQRAVELPNR